MDHPWLDFWNKTAETLGIAAAFSFMGSAFLLWVSPQSYSGRSGLTVIIGGQLINAAAQAFLYGYLGWSFYTAPVVGLVLGLIGSFLLLAVIKVGQTRATDIVEAGVKRVIGQEPKS